MEKVCIDDLVKDLDDSGLPRWALNTKSRVRERQKEIRHRLGQEVVRPQAKECHQKLEKPVRLSLRSSIWSAALPTPWF
jgi:hypothetical protein